MQETLINLFFTPLFLVLDDTFWSSLTSAIVISSVIGISLLIFVIYKAYETWKTKTSSLVFIGEVAVALDEIQPEKEGFVLFHGEHWTARSISTVAAGQKVKIVSKDGFTLIVEPIKQTTMPSILA